MTKTRIFILMAIIAGGLLVSSCGISYENIKSTNQWMTEVRLDNGNFKVVKQIKGEATATYIFGIGGLSKKALTESAISDMLDKADLQGSQAIVNTTYYVNTINIVTPIYFKRTAYATAYVVEFTD